MNAPLTPLTSDADSGGHATSLTISQNDPQPGQPGTRPGTVVVLRVVDWARHYENNRSKELKRPQWFPCPNAFDGTRYMELLHHPDGMAHYGAWCLLLASASRMPRRGLFVTDSRQVMTAKDLARMTHGSEAVFRALLPRALALGWIELVEVALVRESAPRPLVDLLEPTAEQELGDEPSRIPQAPAGNLPQKGKGNENGKGTGRAGEQEHEQEGKVKVKVKVKMKAKSKSKATRKRARPAPRARHATDTRSARAIASAAAAVAVGDPTSAAGAGEPAPAGALMAPVPPPHPGPGPATDGAMALLSKALSAAPMPSPAKGAPLINADRWWLALPDGQRALLERSLHIAKGSGDAWRRDIEAVQRLVLDAGFDRVVHAARGLVVHGQPPYASKVREALKCA